MPAGPMPQASYGRSDIKIASLACTLACLLAFADVGNAQQADADWPSEPSSPASEVPPGVGAGDQEGRSAPIGDPVSICQLVEAAAVANGLPFEFFARVIWQESRFRSDAVGSVTRSGPQAQGIAQFMPMTAAERLLRGKQRWIGRGAFVRIADMDVDEGSPRLECRVSGFDLLLRSDRDGGVILLARHRPGNRHRYDDWSHGSDTCAWPRLRAS